MAPQSFTGLISTHLALEALKQKSDCVKQLRWYPFEKAAQGLASRCFMHSCHGVMAEQDGVELQKLLKFYFEAFNLQHNRAPALEVAWKRCRYFRLFLNGCCGIYGKSVGT